MNELIRVAQLPVIEERLRAMKETVDKRVGEALALVCNEETVQAVKAVRADLNKEFQVLEEQRKAAKKAVLGPYEQFEAVYKECVSDAFRAADAALKGKVDATFATASASRARCSSRSAWASFSASMRRWHSCTADMAAGASSVRLNSTIISSA